MRNPLALLREYRIGQTGEANFLATLLCSALLHLLALTTSIPLPNDQETSKSQEQQSLRPPLVLALGNQQLALAYNALPQRHPVTPILRPQEARNGIDAAIPNKTKDTMQLSKNLDIRKQAIIRKLESLALPNTLPTDSPVPGSADHFASTNPQGYNFGSNLSQDPYASYETLLPFWLNQFRIYPKAARDEGLEGIGELGINIHRNGKILNAKVIKSTGHYILDKALIDMVRRTHSVLPVPESYDKDKEVFYFAIEFSFVAS